MSYRLVFSPEAQTDLIEIYDYVANDAGRGRAMAYLDRIEQFCTDFVEFPLRGTSRDDLRPGLRTIGFERRITIAFHVTQDTITIDRIFYGGRDVDGIFESN